MAFARLIFKAKNIEKLRTELEDEKHKSMQASQGRKVKYTLRQKYRHFWIDLGASIRKRFKKMCSLPKKSCIYRTIYKLKHEGTCENFTLKSIVGFMSGFFLTYIFFMFFVFQLNFKLSTATIMCSIFGSILTIGMAFSYKVRCVVLLLLPQFFSKRGRQALMAYAFILAITGPAKNTLHNMGILSESLACGQEQLKAAVRQIIDVIKKPFYAIRDAIRTIVKTVKVIVKAIKEILLTIKRVIMSILRVIKAAFQFLGKILNICNKELGTPFERCMRVFEEAITDCNAKLGPLFNWLCSITYLVQSVCYIVKIFDFICLIVDFISDSVIGVVVRKVKIFVRHIRTMFYVRIKFSHSFSFETNQSKSITEITTGIVTEIRQRTEKLLTVFDFMSCATSMFFLFIILRVLHYRYKFLTSERFDNRFITKNFRELDMKRAQLEKETVLPLNHREQTLYISVRSIRLVKSEKRKLSKAAVALGMITLKLSTHMMADYALYWVLTVIRYHARFQSNVQAPNVVGLHVEGKGFIASLLRSIVTAFQPLGVHLEIDTIPCLPDPIPPDYDRYIQIASLLILCWILTIFEPYGLRLRHSVMCYYHPVRARQRVIWLYNHILRSRLSFLKFARRQLRRKFTGAKGITKITCKEYLRANIKCRLFRLCLGEDKQDACVVCGEVFRESDSNKPIRCIKPGCPGIYCEQCYADLQNLCTICMEPIQYGDLSDISEEKDSSEEEKDDEKESVKQKKKRKKRRKRCTFSFTRKKQDYDEDDDSDDDRDHKLLLKSPSSSDSEQSTKNDSDYYTSGSSTDNSYTYQNFKKVTDENEDATASKFRDMEKQQIPDYASWSLFADDPTSGETTDTSETTTSKTKNSTKDSEYMNTTISSPFRTDVCTPLTFSKPIQKTRIDVSYANDIAKLVTDKKNLKEEHDKQMFIEEIPLSDRTTTTNLSSSADETSSRGETAQISSETETTLIETPKHVHRIETSTTSSLDSEIMRCQMCGKCKRVPPLDLPLENRLGLNIHESYPTGYKRIRTFLDRFNKNVKYEVLYETPRTSNSTYIRNISTVSPRTPMDINYRRNISTVSPRSPMDINYRIVVPHYDTFINCPDLLDEPAKIDFTGELPKEEKNFIKQIDEFKEIQRQYRTDEMVKKKLASQERITSISDNQRYENNFGETFTFCTRIQPSKTVDNNTNCEAPSQSSNKTIYKQKVQDYYKNISSMQPPYSPTITKRNQNKFVNFVKKIFGKAKSESVPCKLSNSQLLFKKCEENIYVSLPNFTEELSAIQESTSSSTAYSSNSKFITDDSLTTTESSSKSRMGSTEGHIRGGADTEVYTSEQSVTTSTTSIDNKKLNTASGNLHKKAVDFNSSDSEISNLDIFLSSYKRNRLHRNLRGPHPNSLMNNSETSNISESLDEDTLRYSREPAERDQDPSSQKSNFSNLRSSTTNSSTDLDDKRYFGKNTMHGNCTSSDISPRGIENIKGKFYSSPLKPGHFFNTEILKDSYGNPNESQTTTFSTVHGAPRGRSNSAVDYLQESTQRRHNSREKARASSQPVRFCDKPENLPVPTEEYCSCVCKVPSKPIFCTCTSDNEQTEETRKHSLERQGRRYSDSDKYNRYQFSTNSPAFVDNSEDHRCQKQYCARFQISRTTPNPRRLMEDEVSCCSGNSGRSEFPELVYQNTDEFLELVNELGDTLSLRNKERVERTIREFECMSSQNRNLEKPIFDDDSDEARERQSYCQCSSCKNKKYQKYHPCNTKFTRFQARSDGPLHQTSYQHYHRNPMYTDDKLPNFSTFQCNKRWEMNPRTGKWHKLSGDYDDEDNNYYLSSSAPPSPRQVCMCEKRRNSRTSAERNGKNHTASCRCNNCGLPRDIRY